MKRWIAGVSLAALLFATAALTAAGPAAAVSRVAAVGELEAVDKLTLDDALARATQNDFNFKLLNLQYSALNVKQLQLIDQADQLETDRPDGGYRLPDTPEEILTNPAYGLPGSAEPDQLLWLGPAVETNAVVNQVLGGMENMASAMNEMIESQRKELEVAIEQMNTDRKNLTLSTMEAVEGVKLHVTGQYAELLALQRQIDLAEQYHGVLQDDLMRAAVLLQTGQGTREALDDATRALRKQEEQLDAMNGRYRLGLVQMSFDLGIAYNPELELEDIAVDPKPVERRDTWSLLAASYELQRTWNAADQTEWEACYYDGEPYRDNEKGYRDCNADKLESNEEIYLKYNTMIAEEQVEQKKTELVKRIERAYAAAEDAYRSYETARADAKLAADKYAAMQIRFDNGVVTQHDVSKLKFQASQAETQVYLAGLQYYVADRQADAMARGLIV